MAFSHSYLKKVNFRSEIFKLFICVGFHLLAIIMEIGTPIGLLYGPLFLCIYLQAISADNLRSSKHHNRHFITFFIGSFIYLTLYVYSKINIQGETWLNNYYYPCYLFAMGGSMLSYTSFIIFQQLQMPINRLTIEQVFFNMLLWLTLLTALPILIFAADLYLNYDSGIHLQYLIYMMLVFAAIILFVFLFILMPGSTVNRRANLFKLYRCLLTDDLYLETNFTLDKLAHHLGSTPEKCSKILNGYIGTNFYQLLATLRVRHAKKLIQQDVENKLTVEHISFLCGYRSKTSFNSHFKKLTNFTPSEYKQHIRCTYERPTNLQP